MLYHLMLFIMPLIFFSLNVSSIFLEKGFIELELECITTSQNIDFITGQTLQFFILV
jgi:hypothetical protein